MPSQSNPDSPYLASRLQSVLGVRAPGTPSQAGSPDVQAGNVAFPAPPAPASAPVGRPSNPTTPAPAQPVATAPVAPTATSPSTAPASPTAVPGAAAPPPVAPLGIPRNDGSLALTPDGDMRYRQAVVAGRAALGPVPRVFTHASLPELPYELGQRNWNPFTSAWSDAAPTDGMS